MDPIPLNAVQAAAADVAAGTSGTAVAAPVADIAGTAADTAVVAADARAVLSLMPRLMLRLPLIRRATFTVALATSAAIVASTSPAPPAASGFEASGQSMVAVGPVRAPVELLLANEITLQFG